MSKILVSIDFAPCSINALSLATKLGKAFNKELTVLHVIEASSLMGSFFSDKAAKEQQKNTALEKIKALEDKFEQTFTKKVQFGKVTESVLNCMAMENPDLTVMGVHGKSEFRRFFLGSNTFKIANEAAKPVLSVNQQPFQYPFQKLLLPIDRTEESLLKLPHAIQFARLADAEVILLGLCTNEDPESIQIIKDKCKSAQKELSNAEIRSHTDMVFGRNIAQISTQYAQNAGVDLMVIMTEQEISPSNILNGPFAQQIIQEASVPVLSVNPV